ncbi:MAG TPA: hypothetical protein V6C84_24660 [Coleofasciculaceae cyanobacterium]|jgi:hypothetical protein
MATDKPAVMAYLHPTIYRHLKVFQQQNQLRSLSHSVEIILERYLILGSQSNASEARNCGSIEAPSASLTELVMQLSQTCLSLQQEVYELKLNLQTKPALIPSKQAALPSLSGSHGMHPIPLIKHPLAQAIVTSPEQAKLSSLPASISPESCKRGWTGVALAERLKTYASELSRKRSKPGFTEWTRFKDPEGIGWEFKTFTCRFHPLIEFVENE